MYVFLHSERKKRLELSSPNFVDKVKGQGHIVGMRVTALVYSYCDYYFSYCRANSSSETTSNRGRYIKKGSGEGPVGDLPWLQSIL